MASKYFLRTISKTCFRVDHSGKKVGGGRKLEDGTFAITIGEIRIVASTASAAFSEAVKANNRIALCGENDIEKADAVVRQHNDEVRAEVAKFNSDHAGTDLRMKVRSRRVNI